MIPFSVTVLRGQQVRSGEQLAAAEGEGWGRGGKEAGMATEGQCGGGGTREDGNVAVLPGHTVTRDEIVQK